VGEDKVGEGGTQGAGEVGSAFGPVQAGAGQRPPRLAEGGHVDAQRGEVPVPVVGELQLAVEPGLVLQGVGDGESQLAGQVVVAHSRSREVGGLAAAAIAVRDGLGTQLAQVFQGFSDLGTGEAVVPVPSSGLPNDQARVAQHDQVLAGGRRTDPGVGGELAGRTGGAVHQQVQHGRARRSGKNPAQHRQLPSHAGTIGRRRFGRHRSIATITLPG